MNNNQQANSSLNGTTESVPTATNSSYVNTIMLNNNSTITVEQLQKDLMKMKVSMDDMKVKFADQIRDLVGELDEEKKHVQHYKLNLNVFKNKFKSLHLLIKYEN